LVVVVVAVAAVTLAPKFDEAVEALRSLHDVAWGWLVVALISELLSLLVFTIGTYELLIPEVRPGFVRVLRLDLVTIGLSHAVPAGSAAGTAVGYGLLAEEGVSAVDASVAKVVQSVMSGVLLQVMLWVALGVTAFQHPAAAPYLALASLGAVVLVSFVGLTWLLVARQSLLGRLAARLLGWIPKLSPERVERFVRDLSGRVRLLARQPRRLVSSTSASLLNWVFDLLALYACLRAFGVPSSWSQVTIAFCIAQVIAAIPISPGGLGLVEGSLVPILVSFGTGSSVAVLGVLVWRLFNFWMPLPIGGLCYLGIAADRRRGRLPRRPETKPPDSRGVGRLATEHP
jgi:uncharacterized protein (TIRG00374 family)